MEPSFVQTISQRNVPPFNLKQQTFTNVSSQQASPGMLEQYFRDASQMGYMPMTGESINGSGQPIARMINEQTNVSSLSRVSKEAQYHGDAVTSKRVGFRTGSMRAWGVPLDKVEMRATEGIN